MTNSLTGSHRAREASVSASFLTDTPPFHPEAAKRLEERGRALLTRFEPGPPGPAFEEWAPGADLFVSGTIREEDIQGPIVNTFTDSNGSEIGRVVIRNGAAKGLRGDAHADFLALADTIVRTPAFRDTVARDTVRSWLWEWLIAEEQKPLVEELGARLAKAVSPHRILIPIFELIIPARIKLGTVTLVTFSRDVLEELDAFEAGVLAQPDMLPRLKANQEDRRRHLQGKAGALVEITAEQQYASDHALSQTETALGILRLASRGVVVARGRSYCTVKGAEAVQTRETFQLDGNNLRPFQSWLESPFPQQWVLEPELLTTSILPLLSPWFALVARGRERTEFQDSALKAALIFSRATLQESLEEKLLHALTAVESVLLRNDSEPIASSLADRMAFLAEPTPQGRLEKAKLVREVYGYRSRFVHHAEDVDAGPHELAQVEKFMVHAMLSLRALAVKSMEGGTRLQCLDELEARKYQ